MKIILQVEEGIIKDAFFVDTNRGVGIENLVIMDFDVDGLEPDQLTSVPEGRSRLTHIRGTISAHISEMHINSSGSMDLRYCSDVIRKSTRRV